MSRLSTFMRTATLTLIAAFSSAAAYAHSASDAYLTLVEQPQTGAQGRGETVIRVQWDIALRDLDFVLRLDDNGDGRIVWGELRKHQQDIANYAYQALSVSGDGVPCRVSPSAQMVDDHSDGAYASLMFDIVCASAPKRLSLDYRLFFAIDPSHRAIVVMRRGDNIATALLSSDARQINFEL